MEQTITIRTERTTHLTVATLRVYQCLKDKLQDRAEVVDYETLLECGSYNAAKEKGKVRSEGKEYVMKDGDVVLFRFNV